MHLLDSTASRGRGHLPGWKGNPEAQWGPGMLLGADAVGFPGSQTVCQHQVSTQARKMGLAVRRTGALGLHLSVAGGRQCPWRALPGRPSRRGSSPGQRESHYVPSVSAIASSPKEDQWFDTEDPKLLSPQCKSLDTTGSPPGRVHAASHGCQCFSQPAHPGSRGPEEGDHSTHRTSASPALTGRAACTPGHLALLSHPAGGRCVEQRDARSARLLGNRMCTCRAEAGASELLGELNGK